MKNELEYRIREYCGAFEIEIRGYEEKGMFWWKRKEWSWYRTNVWGDVIQTYPRLQPSSGTLKTLEDAQNRIEEWNKGETYHCV